MTQLFIITGASGAGKSSVLKELLQDQHLPLRRFVTTTTREVRPGEKDGKDYWFISKEEFLKAREENQFFEWAQVYGNYYGSSKKEFERLQAQDEPIIMIVDVQGAKRLKEEVPDAIVIFVDAPIDELARRLKERGTSDQDIDKRMDETKEEKLFAKEADYVVQNQRGKLHESIKETKEIILKYV